MEVESSFSSPTASKAKGAPAPAMPPPGAGPPSESEKQRTKRLSRRRRNICLGVTLSLLLALALLVLVLALTVFKAKKPKTTVDSVRLEGLRLSLASGIDLNVSLGVDLSVTNPNKVGFRYSNSSAFLNYRGQVVGEAPIPADSISSGETKPMNLTLTLMADRLLSNSQLYSDVLAGALPLSTRTRISGKVKILVFKLHVVSISTCDLVVYVSNRSVGEQNCRYKTKL